MGHLISRGKRGQRVLLRAVVSVKLIIWPFRVGRSNSSSVIVELYNECHGGWKKNLITFFLQDERNCFVGKYSNLPF